MTNACAALTALSEPRRVAILERLAERPMAVGELADALPVTRPAVSQHLKVLKDAALVDVHAEGTRRVYRIDPRGLGAIREWLDRHWARQLDSFKAFADSEAARGGDRK